MSPACDPEIATGRFPQVAGLRIVYTCDGTTPEIVSIVRAATDETVGPDDTVRLVTNDFMFTGGDGYTVLSGGTDVLTPGDGLLEISIEWVTAHSPVDPQIEGRVTRAP